MPDYPRLNAAKSRRSRWLTGLAALLAIFQTSAAWRALNITDEMRALVSLPTALEFATGAVWTLIWLLAAINLWHGRARARFYTACAGIGFAFYSLGRLAIFAQADYDRQRLPFLAIIIFALSIILVIYINRSSKVHATESMEHGRKSKN